jgi:N-acetyl-anhydromuramyl-L-alanine amidase AmpD
MQLIIKKGDHGPTVLECQKLLNQLGYGLVEDGIFGAVTESIVKKFQKQYNLVADGIVGPRTWAVLREQVHNAQQAFHAVVDEYVELGAGNFIKEATEKLGVTLHHTVSDGDPARVVRIWDQDKRGPVGTHFVIGRTMTNGNTANDGKIVQCMPMENWAHHVLTKRMGFSSNHNNLVNKSYVGIELCSWGALKKQGNRFYTLDGRVEIPSNQVCTLYTPFRTFQYWHKFTNAQIESLFRLLKALKQELKIDYRKDGKINDWFELSWDAMALRRTLTTHTNFEYGKFDTYPQPELVNLIHEIYRH